MAKLAATNELVTNFYTFEGTVKALNQVSIVVNEGETYGLVGESGCGKSVTVRSMMRIVQEPGKITGGKVLLYFNAADRNKGINILKRSEAYMQSIRGDDISMIFQEASSSLNPVLSIGYQVGESFFLHRMAELLEKTIQRLDLELENPAVRSGKGWRRFQKKVLLKELEAQRMYERNVDEIDTKLYELEEREDKEALAVKASLNRKREKLKETHVYTDFISHVPFLRRYKKSLEKTVREMTVLLLTELGVPNPENIYDRYPHELSGGMQQRIVIAIALACHPTLLIADEPTSNLDVTIQAQILDLIKQLKEVTISSVLFITHDLGVVAEVCDRVTVMYAGDTCETATVKELFKEPLHPYTKGLFSSVPKLETGKEALKTIPGIVPNLINPPSGCRFHPRCPSAMEVCSREKPKTIEYSEGHSVSCHLYKGKE